MIPTEGFEEPGEFTVTTVQTGGRRSGVTTWNLEDYKHWIRQAAHSMTSATLM